MWVAEDLQPRPKNIYGVTKTCAESLCQLFSRNLNLPCIVLRTSRFFLEQDDKRSKRESFEDDNLKANEFLFRRVDIQDIVSAHELAIEKAPQLGFERLSEDREYQSDLARLIGVKGYHDTAFVDGPYPVEDSEKMETGHDR
ncbi:MAG: nucleoside-diphosphate-sugar epimerase [Lysobacterales bacterium]